MKAFSTIEWHLSTYPTFDSFMDWVDKDIGLPKDRMLKIYLHAESWLRENGQHERADLVRIKYNKTMKFEEWKLRGEIDDLRVRIMVAKDKQDFQAVRALQQELDKLIDKV